MIDGKSGQKKIKTLVKSVDEASHQYLDADPARECRGRGLQASSAQGFGAEPARVLFVSAEVHRRGHSDVHVDTRGRNRLQVSVKSRVASPDLSEVAQLPPE